MHTFAIENGLKRKSDKNNYTMSKEKQPKDPAEQGKEIKTAADLIQDEHNYRKHSDTNKARIKKSIDEAGLGRSVVIDADGVLVAGNGVQQVIDKDTPVRVVETDGTELVVVKRTDLHTGDPRRKTLALADNATADDVEWDFDAIAEDWTEDEAGEWGVDAWETETPTNDDDDDEAVGGALTEQLKNASYVEKESYFVKKPFVVIFYDESQKEALGEKLGVKIENDTYDYGQLL